MAFFQYFLEIRKITTSCHIFVYILETPAFNTELNYNYRTVLNHIWPKCAWTYDKVIYLLKIMSFLRENLLILLSQNGKSHFFIFLTCQNGGSQCTDWLKKSCDISVWIIDGTACDVLFSRQLKWNEKHKKWHWAPHLGGPRHRHISFTLILEMFY